MPDPGGSWGKGAGAAWRGLRDQLGLMAVAVQVLTRVPVPAPFPPDGLRRAARYFPMVGIGVGLAAAAVLEAVRMGWPAPVAALLSLGASVLLTGALHEDGLADCCDGLFGGATRADALRIMRDSRLGTFGVLGLGLVLGVWVGAVAALPAGAGWIVLPAAHAAGRFWMTLPPWMMASARPDGVAGGLVGPGRWPGGWDMAAAALFGLGPLLLLGAAAVPAALASGLVAAAFLLWVRRRLGGYTGDVLGAVQVVSATAVVLAVTWRAG